MEVQCCMGLVGMMEQARFKTESDLAVTGVIIGLKGIKKASELNRI